MIVTEELIEKFFLKKCTVSEALAVEDYLYQQPEILNRYLGKAEWDQEADDTLKSVDFWDEIWWEIKPVRKRRWIGSTFLKYAIAASVTIAIALLAVQYKGKPTKQSSTHFGALFKHRVIDNNGTLSKEITLPDGSKVKLNAHAIIEYDEPFQNKKREVSLKGGALFVVAKDKTRPFTVYSNQLATTALGTKFSVISNADSKLILVHLFEGKVVVKSSPDSKKPLSRDFYLQPGDELIYYKTTGTAKVKARTSVQSSKQGNMLVFDREPLANVFDQLANKYNVHIQYSPDDFENRYYIGNFDKEDSIERILGNIAKLNGLKLSKSSDNEYLIQKDTSKLR